MINKHTIVRLFINYYTMRETSVKERGFHQRNIKQHNKQVLPRIKQLKTLRLCGMESN